MSQNLQQLEFGIAETDSLFSYLQHRGTDEGYQPQDAQAATDFEPGSPGKLRVLIERINSGQDLWHNADRQLELGSRHSLLLGLMDFTTEVSDD